MPTSKHSQPRWKSSLIKSRLAGGSDMYRKGLGFTSDLLDSRLNQESQDKGYTMKSMQKIKVATSAIPTTAAVKQSRLTQSQLDKVQHEKHLQRQQERNEQ